MFCRSLDNLKNVMDFALKQATEILSTSKDGVDITVKKHVHERSQAQNSYYWVINGEVAKFLDDAGIRYGADNIHFNKDIVHDINKEVFGVETTRKMVREEFCEYMTKVILEWQERTNFEWAPSELPDSYLAKKGYTDNYTRGVINDT